MRTMNDSAPTIPDRASRDEDFSQYVLSDPVDILAVLQQIVRTRTRSFVEFEQPPGVMAALLLGVDDAVDALWFDSDENVAANEAILLSETLSWRTALNGVRIEFLTSDTSRDTYGGFPALRAPIPTTLLRLQRRNAYRAVAPASRPLRASIHLSVRERYTVPVLDISTLGVSLLMDPARMALTAGTIIERVTIDLPDFGLFECGLEVRYLLSAGSRHPSNLRRCGAAMIHVSPADSMRIARYIHALERENALKRMED